MVMLLTSCRTHDMEVYGISYTSVNTTKPQYQGKSPIPKSAKIGLGYAIDQDGKLAVFVRNLTDEILIIDQELSFLINTNGISQSYYDNTIRSTSDTRFSSGTTSAGLNLGAVASAFGIGGFAGKLIGGISVGQSYTSGSATTNTTIFSDMKRISLGPHGNGVMSKTFTIQGLERLSSYGVNFTPDKRPQSYTFANSPLKFKVCISYSFGDDSHFDKIVTDFYVDSRIQVPVTSLETVNSSMRTIYEGYPDVLSRPWFRIDILNTIRKNVKTANESHSMFYIPSSEVINKSVFDNFVQGILFDYK